MFFAGIMMWRGLADSSSADVITFDLDTNIATTGSSTVGSLTATFADINPNLVRLTLNTSGLIGTPQHHVQSWYFNLRDASQDVQFLQANQLSGFNYQAFETGNVGPGNDTSFDFGFTFRSTPPPPFFESGTVVVDLFFSPASGLTLTASDFSVLCPPINGFEYFSAAHVERNRGLGDRGQSVGAPIPEPSHMIFGVLLLGGLVWVERGRIRSFLQRDSKTA